MSNSTTNNDVTNAATFALFDRFRRLAEFSTIQEVELLDVVNSQSAKAERARQRILARLFSKLEIDSLQTLLDTRKNERVSWRHFFGRVLVKLDFSMDDLETLERV